jgi:hypothetical protein
VIQLLGENTGFLCVGVLVVEYKTILLSWLSSAVRGNLFEVGSR